MKLGQGGGKEQPKDSQVEATSPLDPTNPYAASKAAAEMMALWHALGGSAAVMPHGMLQARSHVPRMFCIVPNFVVGRLATFILALFLPCWRTGIETQPARHLV